MLNVLKLIILCVVLLSLWGCADCPDCGSISRDSTVAQFFLDEQIEPDFRYYFNGERTHPRAIIGIHRRYTLEGRFWTPVDITQEQLSSWMDYVRTRGIPAIANYGVFRGFEILDPDGTRIGIWFSVYDWVSIRFSDDNVIRLSVPALRPGTGTFSRNLRI
jgi:hypothetical protein